MAPFVLFNRVCSIGHTKNEKHLFCEGSAMPFKLITACKTDIGREREHNEDNAFAAITENSETGLFIVADGMGGYQAGEVASRIAVAKIRDALKRYLVPLSDQPTVKLPPLSEQGTIRLNARDDDATRKLNPEKSSVTGKTRKLPETANVTYIEDQLKAAIRQANKTLLEYGGEQPATRGMGCTVTMALIHNGQVHIANIGDSRTYLLRQGKLLPLTRGSFVGRQAGRSEADRS